MSKALEAQDAAGPESLRKASLKRALIATLALMALTASLWLVEGREAGAPQAVPAVPVPATPSGPAADTAGTVDPAAPAAPPASDAAEQDSPVESERVPSAAAQSAPQATAPQGAVVAPGASPPGWAATAVAAAPPAPAEPAQEGSAAAVPAAQEAATTVAVAETGETSPRADAPRLHAGPPPGPGYLIQLGVFLDTANAESMRRELERKGYPAHLQARVVLGPYPDRGSALAAQEKIRRERKLDGMILGPRK